MYYSKIVNPKTNKLVNIKSKSGKKILKNYIIYLKIGGSSNEGLTDINLKDEDTTVVKVDKSILEPDRIARADSLDSEPEYVIGEVEPHVFIDELPGQLLHTNDVLREKVYVSSKEYEEDTEKELDKKKEEEKCITMDISEIRLNIRQFGVLEPTQFASRMWEEGGAHSLASLVAGVTNRLPLAPVMAWSLDSIIEIDNFKNQKLFEYKRSYCIREPSQTGYLTQDDKYASDHNGLISEFKCLIDNGLFRIITYNLEGFGQNHDGSLTEKFTDKFNLFINTISRYIDKRNIFVFQEIVLRKNMKNNRKIIDLIMNSVNKIAEAKGTNFSYEYDGFTGLFMYDLSWKWHKPIEELIIPRITYDKSGKRCFDGEGTIELLSDEAADAAALLLDLKNSGTEGPVNLKDVKKAFDNIEQIQLELTPASESTPIIATGSLQSELDIEKIDKSEIDDLTTTTSLAPNPTRTLDPTFGNGKMSNAYKFSVSIQGGIYEFIIVNIHLKATGGADNLLKFGNPKERDVRHIPELKNILGRLKVFSADFSIPIYLAGDFNVWVADKAGYITEHLEDIIRDKDNLFTKIF